MSDLINQIEKQIGPRTLLPLRIANSLRLRGWSVTVPNTRIHIKISCSAANDAGSFPLGTNPRKVKATIIAFPGEFDQTWATQPTPSTPIPDNEAEAWTRVMFGEQLADFAYQRRRAASTPLNRSKAPNHQHKKIFVALIDGHGHPILAPDNIRWRQSEPEPRKLQPTHNTTLRHHLAAHGPYADSSKERDPRTDPDGGWRIQVTGDPLDTLTPTAREAVEHAHQLFRLRGAIHTDFATELLIVAGQTLHVQFRWKNNPNIFAISGHIPQTEAEFRSPQANARLWMGYTAGFWFEELSTGLMWCARRQRIDGVIYLGKRTKLSREPYSVGGLNARPNWDGVIRVPHSPDLQGNTVTAFHHDQLISWSTASRNRKGQRDQYVAQAVTAWTDTDGVAELKILEAIPNTDPPDHVVARTAFRAICDAADSGAQHIATTLDHPVLASLGFIPTADRQTLNTLTMP
ncbi:hypothetical protein [Williamsia sp. 1135]|uniref:hypothetical protein n=1 Tax=Williamsia sp. 1135 TaxID=1889262 RepID=UPI000A10C154|nr:hypothetical protein [Williamsia sp. 1135]ORM38159.1 hypothetical protein BFL43_01000 [Williamsia sp. 1135]